ncbi:MAG: TraR/DksA C4-type zinc finger protein [Bacteroidota bacterium]|nr:TraR/DksA C4-type zinc finger protein [Bacteroidota bacterium]
MKPLADERRETLRSLLATKLEELRSDITSLEEAVKPIAPDSSIGRLSRMDALNSKSVNEELLRNTRRRLQLVERALQRADHAQFGLCSRCGNPIPFGRLEIMPESTRCTGCL